MINLDLIDRALDALERHSRPNTFMRWMGCVKPFEATGYLKRNALLSKCKGLVLHDRILTGRTDHERIRKENASRGS